MKLFLRFDGGFICTSGDRKAAVDWYTRHMGLKLGWDSPAEGMSWLQFPGGAAVTLKSAPNLLRESTVRLCFESPDLAATHAALQAEGVRVTPIARGPGGVECFDFYDLESTRLTAVANPDLAERYPGARFVHYGDPRIGVRDLARSRAWYEQHLSMRLLEDRSEEGALLMDLGGGCPFWLERIPEESFGQAGDPAVRPYILAGDIVAAHRYVEEQGLEPTVLLGTENAIRVFAFYDPDGNRINVWSYPGAC